MDPVSDPSASSSSTPFNPLENLTEKQTNILNDFRNKVQQIETNDEEKMRYFNDMCLLRYLRARDYHADKSFKMMKDSIEFRREYKPESIQIHEVEEMAKLGCIYVHGYDKKRRPIIIARPYKDSSAATRETKFRHLMFWTETGFNLMDTSKGVESFTLLVDYQGFGRRNLDTKTNMDSLHYLINHCPERMGLSLFLDPPLLFWVGWKVLSPFLSQATLNKVRFIYSTTKDGRRVFPEIAEFIDNEELEEDFGGSSSFKYVYEEYVRSLDK